MSTALRQPLVYEFLVPVEPRSVGVIRDSIRTAAASCGEEATERLAIIYSELLSNVIRHSGLGPGDFVDVTFELGDRLRGSVMDRGVGFDPTALPEQDLLDEGGFGLTIVEQLTRTWGVTTNGSNEVWFEL